jgi:shikimate dehydrogenase
MTSVPPSASLRAGYAEVIGDPIDHSLSPLIHSFWLEALEMVASYGRRRVSRAELPAYIAEKRADPAWLGSNVTMPLKLDAVALADGAADWAVAAGAANVLMMRDNKLIAANTDVGAIAALLSRLHQAKARMGSVILLGNGGAARAALVALKLVGLTNVRIQARDLAEATKLAVEFGLEAEPALFTAPIDSDGLINATPLGMAGRECLNCDLERMPDQGWVFDMVYDPAETPLIGEAKKRGLQAVDGLAMLVEQAATSFKLFFGKDAPRDRDAELWQKLKP